MKRIFECMIIAAMALTALIAGCKKKNNGPIVPDVSNFLATAPVPYTEGNPGAVVVSSTSLAAGNYKIKYHFANDSISIAAQSNLAISNHGGSFQTPALTKREVTYLTIDSIINSSGNGVAITNNNLVTLSDSNGLATATIAGKPFKAVYITSELVGSALYTGTTYCYPGSMINKTVGFTISNYTGIAPYTFTHDFFGGNAFIYIENLATGSSTVDTASYGSISVTATAPQLEGNFSFTLHDSSKVVGSFAGPSL